MPTALITGVTGQDGAYLSQLLLEKGYRVVGLLRRSASSDVIGERLRWLGILDHVELQDGNLSDLSSLIRAMDAIRPDEVYNLAAQSFVAASWQQPLLTGAVTGLGAANMLEAVRIAAPQARFYQASSSEMFGLIQEPVQSERTPFYPRSPYAAAKLYAHWMTVNYRESFGLHASQRHPVQPREPAARHRVRHPQGHRRGRAHQARPRRHAQPRQPRRPARLGPRARLRAGDVADAAAGPGRTTTSSPPARPTASAPCASMAFGHAGLHWQDHVRVAEGLKRPAEVDVLLGDAAKARERLGWVAETALPALVAEMVEADLARHRARMR